MEILAKFVLLTIIKHYQHLQTRASPQVWDRHSHLWLVSPQENQHTVPGGHKGFLRYSRSKTTKTGDQQVIWTSRQAHLALQL